MSFEVLLKARRQLEELGFTCKAVNDEPKEPSLGRLSGRTRVVPYQVEFEDVQRLANGHAEHPPEFFYTGSLWKLICPSKREVMLFGDFKQRGILLTKAPKGWGWHTALPLDEFNELNQNSAIRITALIWP
ncbi:hypothetical protein YC2023_046574 [Brassica napus]